MLTTQSTANHLHCKAILGDRYFRLDPALPREVGLDDAGAVDELLAAADEVDLSRLYSWLEESGFERRKEKAN